MKIFIQMAANNATTKKIRLKRNNFKIDFYKKINSKVKLTRNF